MKKLIMLVVGLFCSLFFSSCTVATSDGGYPQPQGGGYGYQEGGDPTGRPHDGDYYERRPQSQQTHSGESGGHGPIKDYGVSKFQDGGVECKLHDFSFETPTSKIQDVQLAVSCFANEQYEKNKTFPSSRQLNEFASAEMGQTIRAEVRFKSMEGGRKLIQTVTVQPNEVSDSIRAKFEH